MRKIPSVSTDSKILSQQSAMNIEQLESAKIDKKSDRPGKEKKSKDICEVPEEVQVEGETVENAVELSFEALWSDFSEIFTQ